MVLDLYIFISLFRWIFCHFHFFFTEERNTVLWMGDSYFSWKQCFEVKNVLIEFCECIFLSAVGPLFLTAPIHCKGSTVSKLCYLMLNLSMEKQTRLHLSWPEVEYIYSSVSFLGELFLQLVYFRHWLALIGAMRLTPPSVISGASSNYPSHTKSPQSSTINGIVQIQRRLFHIFRLLGDCLRVWAISIG